MDLKHVFLLGMSFHVTTVPREQVKAFQSYGAVKRRARLKDKGTSSIALWPARLCTDGTENGIISSPNGIARAIDAEVAF